MDKIIVFLSQTFKNEYLLITLMAMLPLIELKGSILFGIAKNLPPLSVFLLSYLGSCVVVPLVLLCLKPLIRSVKRAKIVGKLIERLEVRLSNKAINFEEKNRKTNGNKGLLVALFLFVAFPAPMTGVWSGATIASFLNLNSTKALFSILFGNLISGIIVLSVALFFQPHANIIFEVFLIIALVILIFSLLISIIKKLFTKKPQKIKG